MCKKEYDLICSLGGNCSAAHQLLYRRMRKFALPFDWTSMQEDECLYKLAEGFENNFAKFLLKENLEELKNDDFSEEHKDRVQYRDCYTKIYYYNHFSAKLDENGEYERVKSIFDRRLKRFIELIESSQKILFIFSSSCKISSDAIKYLSSKISAIYPDKEITLRVLLFNREIDDKLVFDNCEIYFYKRLQNNYDFTKTNIEWQFLDDLIIKPKKLKQSNFVVKKIKKGLYLNLFCGFSGIFAIKLYFLGLRFCFVIGKDRI